MPWYVAWAPIHSNGRLGVFIAFPLNYSRWTKATAFCQQAHRTCNVHCLVPWPRQSTVGVCISRPLDPIVVRLSSAHRTVRCYSPRVPSCRSLCADCPVSHRTIRCTPDRLLFTARCTTSALADCPFHGFLR
jgi:hypothetical protein